MQLIVEKKGYRLLPLLALALAVGLLVLISRDSFGASDLGPFEIDGFAVDANNEPVACAPADTECPKKSYYSGNDAPPADDWAQGTSQDGIFVPSASPPHTAATNCYGSNVDINPAITIVARFICDGNTGISGFPELSIVSPSGDIPKDLWPIKTSNNVTPKDDLSHGYFLQLIQDCQGTPHNVVIVGMERGNNEGSNHWGIELNAIAPTGLDTVADNVSPAANFALDFNRQADDVFISVDLERGGLEPTILVTQVQSTPAQGADAVFELASATATCPTFANNRTSTNLVEQLAPPWNIIACDPTVADGGSANSCRIANGAGTGPVNQGSSSCKTNTKPAQNQACTRVPARDFVEVAIDLTAFGVSRGCFADVLLSTRSAPPGGVSGNIVDLSGADVKDVTAASLPPCSIAWEKRSDIDGSLLGGATFTVGGASGPFACQGDSTNPVTVVDNGLNDDDPDAGQLALNDVCPGTYTITETVAPSGFGKDPDDTRVCTVSTTSPSCTVGTQGTADDCPDSTGTPDADPTPGVPGTGADFCNIAPSLQWLKEAKNASAPGGKAAFAGATFTVQPNPFDGSASLTVTDGAAPDFDGANGRICLNNVIPNVAYTVTETASNDPNYSIDSDPDRGPFTPSASATCQNRAATDNDFAPAFSNTPLSEIEIIFRSLAGAGVTKAHISCPPEGADPENGAADPAFDDTDEVYTNLSPGTYNCTIVVDP